MNPAMWDTIGNALLLVFWFRVWTVDDRSLLFNRYLLPLGRLSDRVVDFLRPVFFRTPVRLVALFIVLLLLVLRGLIMGPASDWNIRMGFVTLHPGNSSGACLVFSLLSFAAFLFKLWGLTLIYVRRLHAATDHPSDALDHLARPFTLIPAVWRPLLLMLAGTLLGILFQTAAGPTAPEAQPWALIVARAAVCAVAEWTNLLALIAALLVLLVIGSWVGLFAGSPPLQEVCRDWIALLMGPLRARPLALGTIDLMPLVLIIVLNYLHAFLLNLLQGSYGAL